MSDFAKKFQLKPEQTFVVQHAPEPIFAELAADLSDIAVINEGRDADAVLSFIQWSEDVAGRFDSAEKSLKPNGLLWIAYPKKSGALETDLTRDKGWAAIANCWQGVRIIKIDDTWTALRFKPKASEADLLTAQYAKKPNLRPIYKALAAAAQSLGDDVRPHIRKNYVAFVRGKQFARIHPSTKTRVDLVLALKEEPFDDMLQPAGNKGDSTFTHKIVLNAASDINDAVLAALQRAYDRLA